MHPRRIATRGIIYKDGKIYAQQLKHNSTQQFWCTPGGGLDPNENLTDGLHREMIEETGIAPVIGRLLFVQQLYDNGKEQLEFLFHITNADDYATVDLSTTSHGEIEVAKQGFIDPTQEHILPEFLQTVDFTKYIDGTLPPLIHYEGMTND
jgi:8-oxo-dGTP pyrophosphatase MutT (NUDIX family)